MNCKTEKALVVTLNELKGSANFFEQVGLSRIKRDSSPLRGSE